ncbi:DUF4105 domain-containing protein [Vibrio tapetis subsp. quintayensis]|uniref:Lnb N-terminal periplasmic domain-containing protein n=1 Tax=Vibrio tapetis TaxID=52443 RepID=UPI0025B5BCC1|nr:DUF4105 domain-containing protein [Vibrio tapetis]MDN3680608.1 DUF4105 domain-containing protein [Vibrio tapetis subsp. quintayensis]
MPRRSSLLLVAITSVIGASFIQTVQAAGTWFSPHSTISDLAKSHQWLKLLHFEGNNSDINSREFFLSEKGSVNPELELLATINSMNQVVKGDVNQHAQCRFPARKLWLDSILGPRWADQSIACPNFNTWKGENKTESISLIFVTGYLGNPASFFGHLLMKLNMQKGVQNSDSPLLDRSINFGADASRDDNPVKYVTYGLFGGYDASYSDAEYYKLEYGYAENEQRELWEYELNLSNNEVRLLEAHLWELSDVKFNYLFLSGNCSTEMAKFIEIVLEDDSELLTRFQPWDMPLDIFKSLKKIEHKGQPLIRSINRRESKYTRIHDKYQALSSAQQQITKSIVDDNAALDGDAFLSLEPERKHRIISLLFDYYELAITDNDNQEAKVSKRKLMLASLKLPVAELEWEDNPNDPPHEAQNPNRINVSLGHSSEFGAIGTLSYRAGYYDFLAKEAARYKDSNAVFFETEVKFNQDEIWLSKFDLFNVTTLNLLHVDLFKERRWAWNGRLTVEQKDLSTKNEERVRLYAGMGWAQRGLGSVSFYALPQLKADFTELQDTGVGVEFGALYTANEVWKTHLVVTPSTTFGTESIRKVAVKWDNRFGDSQDWDVRFVLNHDIATEMNLSYSAYF